MAIGGSDERRSGQDVEDVGAGAFRAPSAKLSITAQPTTIFAATNHLSCARSTGPARRNRTTTAAKPRRSVTGSVAATSDAERPDGSEPERRAGRRGCPRGCPRAGPGLERPRSPKPTITQQRSRRPAISSAAREAARREDEGHQRAGDDQAGKIPSGPISGDAGEDIVRPVRRPASPRRRTPGTSPGAGWPARSRTEPMTLPGVGGQDGAHARVGDDRRASPAKVGKTDARMPARPRAANSSTTAPGDRDQPGEPTTTIGDRHAGRHHRRLPQPDVDRPRRDRRGWSRRGRGSGPPGRSRRAAERRTSRPSARRRIEPGRSAGRRRGGRDGGAAGRRRTRPASMPRRRSSGPARRTRVRSTGARRPRRTRPPGSP